ncbi:MAG: ankyrin repeat domain-containing protein [Legionellaceae bacterium]|nr:ankyrin repeat domain-containing protein [Legionellaceae bacterium]
MNNKRIILCLDIDQTIMNSNAPEHLVDINGSDYFDDASTWVNFLTEMKTYCERQNLQFFVQIITAKDRPDLLTERVFNVLHPFLMPLNQHAEVVHTERAMQLIDPTAGYVPTQYHYTLHQGEGEYSQRLASTTRLDFNEAVEEPLLSPIHICGLTSKAAAMKYIAEYFHEVTPAKNMFLLDDQTWNIDDIEQSAYGFQGVLCDALRRLEGSTKEERTVACHEILTVLRKKIETRIDNILALEPLGLKLHAHVVQDEQRKAHEIHLAAKLGKLIRVKTLIEDEPLLVHTIDAFNHTPLVWAASKGHEDVVALLIKHGADTNQATQLPLTDTSQRTHHRNTPLDWAIHGRHVLTVDTLFQAEAMSHNHHEMEILNDLIRAQNTTHVKALALKNQHALNQLDSEGYTALHIAVIYNQIDIFNDLIEMGADLNTRTSDATGQYYYIEHPHQTAMDLACALDDQEMVFILFNAGAIITPTHNYEQQPIHIFAKHGLITSVQALITAYPEMIHAKDSMNQTPLLWAAANGHHEIITLLIAHGADVNAPTLLPTDHEDYSTAHNNSPLDWAINGEHTAAILTLVTAGGKPNHQHNDFDVRAMVGQLTKLSIFKQEKPETPSISSHKDLVPYEGF